MQHKPRFLTWKTAHSSWLIFSEIGSPADILARLATRVAGRDGPLARTRTSLALQRAALPSQLAWWRPAAPGRTRHLAAGAAPLLISSCSAAPAQDIMGSFFPAWMLCLLIGLVGATCLRLILSVVGVHAYVVVPLLTYLAAALAVTMLVWLVWFGH